MAEYESPKPCPRLWSGRDPNVYYEKGTILYNVNHPYHNHPPSCICKGTEYVGS